MNIDALKGYIDPLARNNLIFVSDEIPGLGYVDIGKEMAKVLVTQTDVDMLPLMADKELSAIVDSHTYEADGIGRYVAIKNLGILFESGLALNVHDKLSRLSKDRVVIIKLEGNIVGDMFCFCCSDSSLCTVSLKDIAYKTIE
jgi:hypothetical protein